MRRIYLTITFTIIGALLFMAVSQFTPNNENPASDDNNYELTFRFPEGYAYQKVAYLIDDGKGYTTSIAHPTALTTLLEGEAYSAIVKLKIRLPEKNTQVFWVRSGKKARFEVDQDGQLKLSHVYTEQQMGLKDFESYLQPFQQDLQDFFKSNKAAIDEGGAAIQQEVSKQIKKVLSAKLDYVQTSKYQYLAFEIFKHELLESSLSSMLLEETYLNKFSKKLKAYWDAKQVESYLAGKRLKPGNVMPEISVLDIHGTALNLPEAMEKTTLIQFWASWCNFCIAEMPNIKEIREEYAESDLAIVSISLDMDSTAFHKARHKYEMDWQHIYGYPKTAKSFGFSALPSLVLLSKDGTILFKKESMRNDQNFEDLKIIIKKSIH